MPDRPLHRRRLPTAEARGPGAHGLLRQGVDTGQPASSIPQPPRGPRQTMGVNGLLMSFEGRVLLYNHSEQAVLAACDARDHRMEVAPGVKSGAIE